MLTKQESILEYDFTRQSVVPDRLTRKTHAAYVPAIAELLQIYRDHVGDTRRELHWHVQRELQKLDDCPSVRISAFCKLLDDASKYDQDRSGAAAKLRQRVFSLAATDHPLVQEPDHLFATSESKVKESIARQLGRPWTDIEADLFADVIEFHRLKSPPDPTIDAGRMLRRYNIAQTQTALYGAVEMTVYAGRDFKTILRYAKLARLMHTITRQDNNYFFRFNGPASIVRETRRYGVAMARFLPGLLAAEDWRMRATVIGPRRRRFALQLSSRDGLRGEIVPSDFDSELEETFHRRWQESDTNGWSIQREATVLHAGQSVLMPDFTFRHPEHGEVLLEIVGFWTPEYLRDKAQRLMQFHNHARILIAVSEHADEAIPDIGVPRVVYKTKLQPQSVLARLAEF
ncbi:DUF790 family protein [Allorhodopirellula heiligendammensis]|uniref:DUF790 family protein n=1 Tax=Allorhodopirellula heiligendammensis TaxID=2714739 RepID=A0A5C6BF19_9BACT|nr:DUF790 family protein [Allorhodopirellula heiligendammensis]TWU10500.1 hypothetical protein Poly21_44040 [Allorhodopirellula heiligendammensis]